MIETIGIVILTLLAERVVYVPRDIRRNDRRIRNRDEDLRTWIEDDDKELGRQLLAATARSRAKRHPAKLAAMRRSMFRDAVQHRYRDQRREAQRVVDDVRDSEQLPHRITRWLLRKPVPTLTAPSDKADVIKRWKQTMQDDLAFTAKVQDLVRSVKRERHQASSAN